MRSKYLSWSSKYIQLGAIIFPIDAGIIVTQG